MTVAIMFYLMAGMAFTSYWRFRDFEDEMPLMIWILMILGWPIAALCLIKL